MKVITNSQTAGRQLREVDAATSGVTPKGQLQFDGFCTTSPIVAVHGGYMELTFTTRSGSEYIVALEERELKSYFVQSLILMVMNNSIFAPLKESAFMVLAASAYR